LKVKINATPGGALGCEGRDPWLVSIWTLDRKEFGMTSEVMDSVLSPFNTDLEWRTSQHVAHTKHRYRVDFLNGIYSLASSA
jgi:hypothetical protein